MTDNYENSEENYNKIKAENERLEKENLRLREINAIYYKALSLTDHIVSYIDIPKRTLNNIYYDGDIPTITPVMQNAPESIIETGIVHPEDVKTFRKFYDDIYSGKPSGESGIFRTTEKGRRAYVKMLFKTIFDENGNPEKAICFSDDLTTKVLAENRYTDFKKSITLGADFSWEIDLTNDKVVSDHSIADSLWGKKESLRYSKLLIVSMARVLDDYKPIVLEVFSRENMINAYNSGKRELSLEYPMMNKQNKLQWLRSYAHIVIDMNGNLAAIICSNDITSQREHESELLEQAERDPMTGLLNRRGFISHVEEFLREADEKSKGQMLIIDVDDFKSMNDRYGHIFGDGILTQIADKLTGCFRQDDFIGRIGGDEFMIFSTNELTNESLSERMKKLQNNLKNLTHAPDGTTIDVTLSIGVTSYIDGDSFKDMYQRADKALYDVKNSGKHNYKVS